MLHSSSIITATVGADLLRSFPDVVILAQGPCYSSLGRCPCRCRAVVFVLSLSLSRDLMKVSASGAPQDMLNISALGAPQDTNLMNISASGAPQDTKLMNVSALGADIDTNLMKHFLIQPLALTTTSF